MTAPLKPSTCSECPAPLQHPAVGRPKTCCSPACYEKRRNRLRKEERAWRAENLRRDEANARYLREDFGPWARGATP